jgi:predicted Zn-dependent protease
MRGAVMGLLAALLAGCAMHGAPSMTAPPPAGDQERVLLSRVAVHDDPYLAGLLARITAVLRLEPEETAPIPAVVVLRDPTIAAFALPGGPIYVHTGLLARLENEAQLATILARTLAHASRRAAPVRAPALQDALLTMPASIGAALAAGPMDGAASSPVADAILGANLTALYVAAMEGYGGVAEREADASAVRRLVRAGYDLKEAARAYERLRREAKAGGVLERFFLGADAALAERVETTDGLVRQDYAVAAAAADRIVTTREFEEIAAMVARDNGRLEARAGRFRAAHEQLGRALAVWPADAQAYLALGELLRLRAQRARGAAERDELARRALAAYERSNALDPGQAPVARALGLLYYQQGQRDRAREAFARYVALSPEAPDVPRVREYIAVLER